MASKTLASTSLLLSLNFLFFALVTSTEVPCAPPPKSPSYASPPMSPSSPMCPTLKLGVCGNLLNDLVHLVIGLGSPAKTDCCSLIDDLADLDAALCLCTAIKADILGINLNVPVSLSLVLNACDKQVPSGFQCPTSSSPLTPTPEHSSPPPLKTPTSASPPPPKTPAYSSPPPLMTPELSSPPPPKSPTYSSPPAMSPTSPICPTIKLGVCGDLLDDLVHLVIGLESPAKKECCNLIDGLADLDAALCLCTAIEADVLGVNLNIPVSLSLVLNACDKQVPSGFQCPKSISPPTPAPTPPPKTPTHSSPPPPKKPTNSPPPPKKPTSSPPPPKKPTSSPPPPKKPTSSPPPPKKPTSSPPPPKKPTSSPPPPKKPTSSPPPPKKPTSSPPPPKKPTSSPPPPKKPTSSPPPPTKATNCPPPPKTPKSPPTENKCPINTLKLGACGDLLNNLAHIVIGTPSKKECCPLIQGLTDLDAAVCLCTALKADVLGLKLNIPISLSLVLNALRKFPQCSGGYSKYHYFSRQ